METQIHPTAIIHPKAKLGQGVSVGPFAVIGEHVQLGDRVQVGSHASVEGYTSIGDDSRVFPKAIVGTIPQDLKYVPCESYVVVGKRTTIRECVTINPGTAEGEVTAVGDDCLLMAYCHVAHNCTVGNSVIMANVATLAGHVEVADHAVIGGLAAVHQFVRIGEHVMIAGTSTILQDIVPYSLAGGNPCHISGINFVGLKRKGFSEEQRSLIKQANRIVFRENLTIEKAIQKIKQDLPQEDCLQVITRFLEAGPSKRGYTR